jgi:hypothetical protein
MLIGKRKVLGDSWQIKPWNPSYPTPGFRRYLGGLILRVLSAPAYFAKSYEDDRVTFAPSSAYDSVQVSHDDAVTPALILAKCGPSISTLDCP